MTKQCIEAMEFLYAQERKTDAHIKKEIIDEALDQILSWADSERPPSYLVRDAKSNAKKKVYRRRNRTADLDIEGLESPEFNQPGIEMIEWKDIMKRATLTKQQQLVFCRCEQGYSINEIALECGLSVKAIYSIRQRARAVVHNYMEKAA